MPAGDPAALVAAMASEPVVEQPVAPVIAATPPMPAGDSPNVTPPVDPVVQPPVTAPVASAQPVTAPPPVSATPPVSPAPQAAAPGVALDFNGFMQNVGKIMQTNPAVNVDYLAKVKEEIATAFQTPLNAITDIAQNQGMVDYAVQVMQRDQTWA